VQGKLAHFGKMKEEVCYGLRFYLVYDILFIDAQGQTVRGGDKSGKFQNWPTSAENSKVLE